jgi:lipopolysaccharide biosynthesis regulator YciM
MASRQLLDIYQQERDWNQAIETAQRLKGNREFEVESLLCHYHCELAEQAVAQGQYAEAAELLSRAPAEGRASVRASLLEGQLAVAMEDGARAIQALQRIEHLGPEFVPETLDLLRQAFELSGRQAEWTSYLETLAAKHGLTSVVLARCTELEQKQGPEAAAHFLGDFLNSHPSLAGMERLIALQQTAGHTEGLPVLSKIAALLTQAKPRYRCKHCGFSSRTLYWQCPGCKRWGTIKPIHGIEGE